MAMLLTPAMLLASEADGAALHEVLKAPPAPLEARAAPSEAALGTENAAPAPEKKKGKRERKKKPKKDAGTGGKPEAPAPGSPQHFAFSAFQISPEPTALPKPKMMGARKT
eukprot:CAMPEP_0119267346 /NCGR_PEP_ID=MMETSP1329-20130426/5529_1 /TAXON_ID=114041 /ORGANISM="Genus nov. species nov., Strain RCC1024" /LENGTH=110 /DNA_ID=CAMNT_0007267267 /DNA_START=156 /DNA_END=488 /DNA_ORIENTATION=-